MAQITKTKNAMTREEEKLKAADEYVKNRIKEGQGRTGDVFPSYLEGAEWADSTMIEKACEWWKDELSYPSMTPEEIKWCNNKINKFRKAMEKE